MRTLSVFNHVSLDGYFVDRAGSMLWAKPGAADDEWDAFTRDNAAGDGVLLFGRVTYDLMNGYWPTPLAMERDADVAKRMNDLTKVVFSRTLRAATWANTTLVAGDPAEAIARMKAEPGPPMTILGSGTIVAQLAQAGLIDEYRLIVNPILLGDGRTLFEGIPEPIALELAHTRAFKNGNVLACYRPAPP